MQLNCTKQHGKNSQYALCASQWHKTLTYKDDFFKDGKTYDADFTKEFGYAPPYQAAESSAALLVFKDAFERANLLTEKSKRCSSRYQYANFLWKHKICIRWSEC